MTLNNNDTIEVADIPEFVQYIIEWIERECSDKRVKEKDRWSKSYEFGHNWNSYCPAPIKEDIHVSARDGVYIALTILFEHVSDPFTSKEQPDTDTQKVLDWLKAVKKSRTKLIAPNFVSCNKEIKNAAYLIYYFLKLQCDLPL